MKSALAIGALLALGSLAWVLYPLFFEVRRAPSRARHRGQPSEDAAVTALREIEFDRATGKLADADYVALKARYTRDALASMRVAERAAVASDDEVEAAVLAYRARRTVPAADAPPCASCGPRPEPDARWCSSCGRFLAGCCAHCGAPAAEPGARFCTGCGHGLAA